MRTAGREGSGVQSLSHVALRSQGDKRQEGGREDLTQHPCNPQGEGCQGQAGRGKKVEGEG